MHNESEILLALKEREKILLAEVERLLAAQSELQKIQNAIKALSPDDASIDQDDYDEKLPWKERILIALRKLGKATAIEVAAYISSKEPNNDGVKTTIPAYLSRMTANSELRTITDRSTGRTIYIINEKSSV